MHKEINFTINGVSRTLTVNVGETVLEVVRDRLGLTGTKIGCEVGECGACTVMIDGEPIDSCIHLAVWIDGKSLTTIEGLAEDGQLTKLQENFIEAGAVQCGYCTPGMILSASAFLRANSNPTDDDIKYGLSGNFCRCTGYQTIVEAVKKTVKG